MRVLVASVIVSIIPLVVVSDAHAATYVVTHLGDTAANDATCVVDNCSFRQAMHAAAVDTDLDDVVFAPGLQGTITLSNGPISMPPTNIRVTGPGSPYLILDGGAASENDAGAALDKRIIVMADTGTDGSLEVRGLTLQNGLHRAGPAFGGCIFGGPSLVLREVRVQGCRAVGKDDRTRARGAGIGTLGTLLIEDSTIRDNRAIGSSDGIDGGSAQGGGVWGDHVTVRRSTFAGNEVRNWDGGVTPQVAQGAALYLFRASALENVTVSNNSVFSNGNYDGGGSVFVWSDATLRHVTIVDNASDGSGGSGIVLENTASATVTNSIIGNNGRNCLSVNFSISGTDNVEYGGDRCAAAGMGVASTTDPALGVLADNGGYVQTRAIGAGSSARNLGTNTDAPSHDARGRTRALLAGDRADAGAFEFGAPLAEVSKLADTADGVCLVSDCSLREALAAAMAGESVRFKSSVTGTLVTDGGPVANAFGEIRLDKNVSILGPVPSNPASLVISGNAHHRVFNVGSLTMTVEVSLRGLTVANGRGDMPTLFIYRGGGGILNQGRLTIEDAEVRDNVARPHPTAGALGFGGGIYSLNRLTLRRVVVRNNLAEGVDLGAGGGGVASYTDASGSLTILDSTITGNTARGGLDGSNTGQIGSGGGLFVVGPFDVARSTVDANSAVGGGIGNPATMFGGEATGGGIHIAGPFNATIRRMVNVTVANNSASGAPGSAVHGMARGGGVFIEVGSTLQSIVNATIAGNTVTSNGVASGGGIHDDAGPTTVRNTVIAGNKIGVDPGNCSGPGLATWVSDHNLRFGDTTCPATGFIAGDPELAALANNGGPTRTMLPAPSGAGVDTGTCFGALVPKDDQRGQFRPSGDTCDIGAIEIPGSRRSVSPASPATNPGATRRGSGGSAPIDPTPNRRSAP